MWRNDAYIEPVKFPAGLGYEAAGIVDAVGKDVTDFAAGDAVSTIPAFSLNQYFTYGEVILAADYAVVKHPEWLSYVEAASIWMMFITAYGAHVASDPVGGPAFPKLISALADRGIAYIYGALSEGDTPIPVLEMISKMTTVKGYSIRLVVGDEARRKTAVEYVVKGLASGALKPIIDRTFEFDDMVEVHRYLENSGQFGKIVVTL